MKLNKKEKINETKKRTLLDITDNNVKLRFITQADIHYQNPSFWILFVQIPSFSDRIHSGPKQSQHYVGKYTPVIILMLGFSPPEKFP